MLLNQLIKCPPLGTLYLVAFNQLQLVTVSISYLFLACVLLSGFVWTALFKSVRVCSLRSPRTLSIEPLDNDDENWIQIKHASNQPISSSRGLFGETAKLSPVELRNRTARDFNRMAIMIAQRPPIWRGRCSGPSLFFSHTTRVVKKKDLLEHAV